MDLKAPSGRYSRRRIGLVARWEGDGSDATVAGSSRTQSPDESQAVLVELAFLRRVVVLVATAVCLGDVCVSWLGGQSSGPQLGLGQEP